MTGDRVAVLMGGWTSEARVSRVTASFCGQAARNAGWDAVEIEVDRNIAATLAEMKPARVFNALHGQIGEDGNIQGLLNICLLYTSPSPRDRTRSRMPSSA